MTVKDLLDKIHEMIYNGEINEEYEILVDFWGLDSPPNELDPLIEVDNQENKIILAPLL